MTSATIVRTKKYDLRDYFNDGHTIDDLRALAAATPPAPRYPAAESNGVLKNYTSVPRGEGGTQIVPILPSEILDGMLNTTGGWPKKIAGKLFFEKEPGEISHILQTSELFAYAYLRVKKCDWVQNHPACCTKSEFYSYCSENTEAVSAVQTLPHFPHVPNVYYSHPPVGRGNGAALREFLSFFTPAEVVDVDLLRAAVLTLFWGGVPGTRPAFLFSAPSGQATGKSSTAEEFANLVGGVHAFSRGESVDKMKSRLLTRAHELHRCLLLDNIKTARFSWADFESLLTSKVISGHELYRGERSIPNYFVWLITANAPGLSRDAAQRIIPIYLKKPSRYGAWKRQMSGWIEENRQAVIDDVAAVFEKAPVALDNRLRWGDWAIDILGRFEDGADPQVAHDTILCRQSELDVDEETFGLIWEALCTFLERNGCDLDVDMVFIKTATLAEVCNRATGVTRMSVVAWGREIKGAIGSGQIKNLELSTSNSRGHRGFVWVPSVFKSKEIRPKIDYRLADVGVSLEFK